MAAVTNSPARASEALNGIEPSASAFLYDLTILFKAVVLQPDNLMNVNNLSTSVSPTVFPSISLRDAVSDPPVPNRACTYYHPAPTTPE